jgi:hypothetical protein
LGITTVVVGLSGATVRVVVDALIACDVRARESALLADRRQGVENGREAERVAAGDVVTDRNLVNPPA